MKFFNTDEIGPLTTLFRGYYEQDRANIQMFCEQA